MRALGVLIFQAILIALLMWFLLALALMTLGQIVDVAP